MISIQFPTVLGQTHVLWGQTVQTADLLVVLVLVLLEGVLSIDNALVLGLLAKRLPKHQQARALSYGLIGAFVFRFIAIATATFLLQWTFAKFLGGAYLVYIAVKHLFESRGKSPDEVVLDARQEAELKQRSPFGVGPVQTEQQLATRDAMRTFWWTVLVIEMTDIAFAVDSIVAAIGVVGSPPPGTPPGEVHPKLWVVLLGGFLGVVVMRFAAALFIRLLDKFPRFELAAYLLVLVIGGKLLADWGFNSDWSGWGWTGNQVWAESYVSWLKSHWPLRLPATDGHHPHLLDFHDLRRPECILFWLIVIATFCLGFLPPKAAKKLASE